MDQILQLNLPPSLQLLANNILIWIGYAAVIGLLARMIIPARQTRGLLITLLVGFAGCCIGPLVLSSYFEIDDFNPIGLVGFLSSFVTAIILLILFHFTLLVKPIKKKEDDSNTPTL